MSNSETITARFMTRFQCIGTACEDNCCHGWQVQIEKRHYQILKHSMSGSKAEREEFREAVKRDHTEAQSDKSYAWIKLDEQGPDYNCPFLDRQKLCSVQGRYGEKALPQICSTYPRSMLRNNERIEVWGMLSCPELARQCLLHEDSMDLVDGTSGLSPRLEPTDGLRGDRTAYQAYLDDVRGVGFQLLSLREYPLSTRLFMLAYLGKQTAELFHRDIGQVDEGKLAAVIDHVVNPETIATWNRELASLPAAEAVTANLVNQLITERMTLAVPIFKGLVQKALASYGDVQSTALSDLWAAYSRRRQAWLEVAGSRIDLYFENYAKNYWMREWYIQSPTLLTHVQRLLVRVAVLRFLLFSHPSLKERPAADSQAWQETLDRAAVEVFYKFSRGIEHDNRFMELMTQRLIEQGAGSFTHAALMARV